jgi:hypothetical protein
MISLIVARMAKNPAGIIFGGSKASQAFWGPPNPLYLLVREEARISIMSRSFSASGLPGESGARREGGF